MRLPEYVQCWLFFLTHFTTNRFYGHSQWCGGRALLLQTNSSLSIEPIFYIFLKYFYLKPKSRITQKNCFLIVAFVGIKSNDGVHIKLDWFEKCSDDILFEVIIYHL